jgi:hypothetical protein
MATERSVGWMGQAIGIVCGGLAALLVCGLLFHTWMSGVAVAISISVIMAVHARRDEVRRRRSAQQRATSAGTTPR